MKASVGRDVRVAKSGRTDVWCTESHPGLVAQTVQSQLLGPQIPACWVQGPFNPNGYPHCLLLPIIAH